MSCRAGPRDVVFRSLNIDGVGAVGEIATSPYDGKGCLVPVLIGAQFSFTKRIRADARMNAVI